MSDRINYSMFKKVLASPIVEFIIRWFVGCIFIYASFHKITDPALFAKIIYGYGLFPHTTINLIAITLPFIELITGICLILGIWPRATTLIAGGMLACFIIAISINLIRGHEFDCGCFSAANSASTAPVELLIRDLIWITCCAYLFFFANKRLLVLRE